MMNVVCPECSASGRIDEDGIPANGRDITCPRCKHRFHVERERSCVEIIQQRETMGCPKCATQQPVAETCASCGIVIQKYIQSQAKTRETERLETVGRRSELQRVDAWYSDLFDRRLTTIMVRVLTLLLVAFFFMANSTRNARRNQMFAEASRQANEGPVRAKPDDKTILPKLHALEGRLRDAANQCVTQCDMYTLSWYNRGEPGANLYREHQMNASLADGLEAIRSQREVVEKEMAAAGTPSKDYWPYYYKVKGLYNVYVSLYELADNPETTHYDLAASVSRLTGEMRNTMAELDRLRPAEFNAGGAQ